MIDNGRSVGAFALRLIVVLGLLGCARVGNSQGTWSVISLPQRPGDVYDPSALAVDAAGNLYLAEESYYGGPRIRKRDAQGNWSVLAAGGPSVGQVNDPNSRAVDGAGNLYVAETNANRIEKRDAQGNWSVIATLARDRRRVQHLSLTKNTCLRPAGVRTPV